VGRRAGRQALAKAWEIPRTNQIVVKCPSSGTEERCVVVWGSVEGRRGSGAWGARRGEGRHQLHHLGKRYYWGMEEAWGGGASCPPARMVVCGWWGVEREARKRQSPVQTQVGVVWAVQHAGSAMPSTSLTREFVRGNPQFPPLGT